MATYTQFQLVFFSRFFLAFIQLFSAFAARNWRLILLRDHLILRARPIDYNGRHQTFTTC